MARPTREQAKARRALIQTFVAVMGDDVTVTLQTNLEEAIEHLPAEKRRDAQERLESSGLDGNKVPLLELFRNDPDLG